MRWAAAAFGLLLGGCYTGAEYSETDPGVGDPDEGVGETLPEETGETSGEPDAEVPEPPAVVAKRRPLQHLTRAQYEATVSDLWPGAPTGFAGEVEVTDAGTGETRVLGALDPDDVQQGFELGTAMSSFLPEKYFDRAEAIAAALADDLDVVLPCAESSPGDECAESFVSDFGLRAFRRPPTAVEADELLSLYDEVAQTYGFEAGVEAMAFAMLSSPPFLYHLESAADGEELASDYELASRLSYFIIGSMPDQALFDAAGNGELGTPEGLVEHTERLLVSPRAAEGLYNFLRQWLVLDAIGSLQKDVDAQPDFDPTLGPDLRASLEEQLRSVARTPEATVADLFVDRSFYVNDRLAEFYGVARGSGDPEDFVPVDATDRAGVLGHPGVLALNSKLEETQLVARGLFVRDRLLCLPVPLPPEDVPLDIPEVDPNDPPANMRERFERHVESPSCAGCHVYIDPPGFALENYDGLGRYRIEDVYGAIDPSGELTGAGDADGTFANFEEFNRLLAQSETVRDCVGERMFEVALGRPVSADDDSDEVELEFLREHAAASDGALRDLARAIVSTVSFRAKPQQ